MSENSPVEAPVGAVETGGGMKKAGKEKKKKRAFHFPCLRRGTYDLDKAEKKYGIVSGNSWRHSDGQSVHEPCVQPKDTPTRTGEYNLDEAEAKYGIGSGTHNDASVPEVLLIAEEQLVQDILDKGQSVHEPSVQPKDTPTRLENSYSNPPDGAVETDGGSKEAGREEKKIKKNKNRFWKLPSLYFPCLETGTYDLDKAENKYGIESGTHSEASVPEVSLTDEEPLVQNILDKGHTRKQYKIGRKLGEGGCGSVYEGTRCRDGLKVAVKYSVKVPGMPSMKVPGHPKRLPIEIGLMLKVNKGPTVPQIIKLLDWVDDIDHYVMVIERPMPCMDLFNFVFLRGGTLDEGTAQNIMRQAIDAAKFCCERGVFHRDIKLENVLVNQDTMEVKLIDFGCGALMKKSAFKVFQGTRMYCPPEFNMNGKYHAKPTTVWTLGFMLYEMLCGECPTLYDRHMISVNLWTRPGLSKECCQMICDCLQPKPKKRLSLDEMHLHDWFEVQRLRLAFVGLVTE
ncbi:serine/threonine-protein kinase pim-2-like [Garra rufa]|uniref:serine/threonine-protein kinase pim-2-like n=1 Tax=Garra rufa TaxID=137080 RepID=UPI003CCEA74D